MPSVLIIEDTSEVRALLCTIPQEVGHVVREASLGLDGIHQCHQSPPDVVITDLHMPRP